MSSFKISLNSLPTNMVIFVIVIIVAVFLTIIYTNYYRKISSMKIKLYNRLEEKCKNKIFLQIIIGDKSLTFKKGNVSLNEIIHYSETKGRLKVIENFVSEVENGIDYISKVPFCSTRKEIFKIKAKIEAVINTDDFSQKITSINGFKILSEVSNIMFQIERCNEIKLSELFFRSVYLLAKVKYIRLFE